VLQLTNVCSLFVYNADQAAIVTWNAASTESVALQDKRFHFGAADRVAVVLRIDEKTVTSDATGIGSRNILTVPVQQPLDDLLLNATSLTAQIVADGELSDFHIDLKIERMSALMNAVGKCRAGLK